MKAFPVEYEVMDDVAELRARVKSVDAGVFEVHIYGPDSAESFAELARAVIDCMEKMK